MADGRDTDKDFGNGFKERMTDGSCDYVVGEELEGSGNFRVSFHVFPTDGWIGSGEEVFPMWERRGQIQRGDHADIAIFMEAFAQYGVPLDGAFRVMLHALASYMCDKGMTFPEICKRGTLLSMNNWNYEEDGAPQAEESFCWKGWPGEEYEEMLLDVAREIGKPDYLPADVWAETTRVLEELNLGKEKTESTKRRAGTQKAISGDMDFDEIFERDGGAKLSDGEESFSDFFSISEVSDLGGLLLSENSREEVGYCTPESGFSYELSREENSAIHFDTISRNQGEHFREILRALLAPAYTENGSKMGDSVYIAASKGSLIEKFEITFR